MNTQHVLKIFVLTFLLALIGLPRFVFAGPSADGQASVTIQIPLDIKITDQLEFGQIRSINVDAYVIIDPKSNSRTGVPPELLAATNSGLHHRAEFTLTGDDNAIFNFTLSASRAQHDRNTNPDLEVKDLVSYIKTTDETINGFSGTSVLDPSGNQTLYVGATLVVLSGAKFGKYEGDVTITINY